ncbi:MAG TPA: FlgD immunoglobulin-like domain containing protein [Candidatus Krumholzibacteria bacterium]|nr:FlgD immunoglobulin-like domain containing protein [Candidatus Krumholzibacteria bacterium]HPD72506.1 FlgD immunoglobulin-like domain containing protein [Candidatus Krumholzibacteria bacterium]HRY40562.1 FlgD immunoglobulin-like domain containing protein [Candidatus Krumholzibacteria bacterium]
MTRRWFWLGLCVLWSIGASAAGGPDTPVRVRADPGDIRHGGVAGGARAEVDTLDLLGGPARLDGRFEDAGGQPSWHGWAHEDLWEQPSYWQVSPFLAPHGQNAMWCGTVFPDGDPGYGNDWRQNLVFSHAVADPSVPVSVRWTATLRNDTEPRYDYTYLQVNRGGSWESLRSYDGECTILVDETVVLAAGELVGPGGDEVQLRVRFSSDGAWSDEDGLWDTDGACQLDDVTVTVDGSVVDDEDFEDGVSDRWRPVAEAVGDFAALWIHLVDLDPCVSNSSAQVAFIDDGLVVPGTGGTPCINWCYGPGGYIVNHSGGLLGDPYYLANRITSPVLAWPAGADAASFEFGVYRHETLSPESPGIVYQWHVRSVNTGDPADLAGASWRTRYFLYYGSPAYLRQHEVISDLLVPNPTHVQVSLLVIDDSPGWWEGDDGTPAPYFDNVRVTAWTTAGPSLSARSVDLFNDGFPAAGAIDPTDLARNAVRLDMAGNISPAAHLRNDPGDSVVVTATTIRPGAVLAGPPQMHVRMKANSLFDAVRELPAGLVQTGAVVTGWVDGDSTFNAAGEPVPDRWHFDLPDSDFFYPGDVLHYRFEVRDDQAGEIGLALLPADTAGFASFHHDLLYDSDFIVRALPTMVSPAPDDQPEVLFWNDFGTGPGENHWHHALRNLGFTAGVSYDLYTTRSPTSGVGNGLGGRATSAVLSGYRVLLYSAGDLALSVLGNGDFYDDPSNDLAVLTQWFGQGGKRAFLTGDHLVSALLDAGAQGAAFVSTYLDVSYHGPDVSTFIGNQVSPRVASIAGNGVISSVPVWIAYGGCPSRSAFDAITGAGSAVRLAEFTGPDGQPGVYPFAAAVYACHAAEDAQVVLMPVDFRYLLNAPGWTPPAGSAGKAARTIILDDVLTRFSVWFGPPIAVAPDAVLRVSHHPNPFNPATTIALDLPRDGDVSVRIFDLRGALVRTLVDERLATGRHEVAWHGTDDRGAAVPSGVYFCETRAAGEVKVHKLALVK